MSDTPNSRFLTLTPTNVLVLCLIFIWLEFLATLIILFRQVRHVNLNSSSLPEIIHPFRRHLPRDYMFTSGQYEIENSVIHLIVKLYEVFVWSLLVLLDLFPFFWTNLDWTNSKLSEYDFTANFLSLEIRRDISFAFWIALLHVYVLRFPGRFLIMRVDKKFGLYGETIRHWITVQLDDALVAAITLIVEYTTLNFLLRVGGFEYLSSNLGPYTKTTCFLLYYSVIVLAREGIFCYTELSDRPTLIPVPDGLLRIRLEEYCRKTHFNPQRIRVKLVPPWEGPNAFCYSLFGTFEIIVFHSSIIQGFPLLTYFNGGLTVAQLQGIFAHEVGHWLGSHVEISVLKRMIVNGGLLALANSLKNKPVILQAMGFSQQTLALAPLPFLPGLFIAQNVVMRVLYRSVEFFMQVVRQWMEYEADENAAKDGFSRAQKEALVKISGATLFFPSADNWYSLTYRSHPTLVQRVENIT